MFNIKIIKFLFLISLILLLGCKDAPIIEPTLTTDGYSKGVLITNEGNFQSGNASVTFYDTDEQAVQEKIFETTNNQPLGDVLQSITVDGNRTYLTVNNSQKIEIVNTNDFKSIGTINGLTSPRHLLVINETTAYVSDLYAAAISVIDLTTNSIISTIPIGGASEEMVKIGDEVFVTQPSLFDNYSQQLFVINTNMNEITDSITVGYNPSNLQLDRNNQLWVVCNGDRGIANQFGGIYRINPNNKTVTLTLPFTDAQTSFYPRLAMNAEKEQLYFLKLGVFKMSIEATELPTTPFIEPNGRDIYGLGVHPATGNVYIGESGNFVQRGTVTIYDHTGTELNSFKAGVGINGFYFN